MIAKITRGTGFGGAVRYVLDKRADLSHGHQPEIVGGNMAGRSSGDLTREFSVVCWQRPDVVKPVEHVSLSFGRDERPLTNEEMSRVADEYLKRRGFDLERTQYVVVRHHDKGHQHCHVLLNRVRTDLGLVPLEYRDYVKNKEVCRSMERDFALRPVVSAPRREKAPTRGEDQMKRDRGEESVKERLKVLIQDAARGRPTMGTFVKRLEDAGVQVRVNASKTTAHVSGISYRLDDIAVKGSGLGRGYSFLGLQREHGVRYEVGRDRPELDRVTRLTTGNDPVRGLGRLPTAIAARGVGRVPALSLARTLGELSRDVTQGKTTRALVRLAVQTALPPQARAVVGLMRALAASSRNRGR